MRSDGIVLTLYDNSLWLVFLLLFVASVVLHATTGVREFNEEQMAHGQEAITTLQYLGRWRFWFESFQNWQASSCHSRQW